MILFKLEQALSFVLICSVVAGKQSTTAGWSCDSI